MFDCKKRVYGKFGLASLACPTPTGAGWHTEGVELYKSLRSRRQRLVCATLRKAKGNTLQHNCLGLRRNTHITALLQEASKMLVCTVADWLLLQQHHLRRVAAKHKHKSSVLVMPFSPSTHTHTQDIPQAILGWLANKDCCHSQQPCGQITKSFLAACQSTLR